MLPDASDGMLEDNEGNSRVFGQSFDFGHKLEFNRFNHLAYDPTATLERGAGSDAQAASGEPIEHVTRPYQQMHTNCNPSARDTLARAFYVLLLT